MKNKGFKKIIAFLLCLCLAFAFCALTACEKTTEPGGESSGITDTTPDDNNGSGDGKEDDGKEDDDPADDKPNDDKPTFTLTKYLQQTEMPVLEITTQDSIDSKYSYVAASYKMTSESGEYDFTADGEIRLRGNYTRTLTKKPYRIKFSSKQSPFGMPESKSWYLLNEATDFSFLRNYLGYTYADDLLDYSLRARYVQVKLNGDYRGIYLLTDKRGEDANRVPVILTEGIDTGWIIEVDNRAIGGDNPANATPYEYCQTEGIQFGVNAFYCNVPESGMQAFVISEPEAPTPEQFNAISSYVTEAIASLSGNSFGNYIDTDSMARYYMVKELWHDTDVGSVYFYRENGSDKIKLGPVWDLDLTCGISKALDAVPGSTNSYDEWFYRYVNVLIKPVFQSATFRTALKKNWNETYSAETADLLKGIDDVTKFLAEYQQLNYDRWDGISEGKVWTDENGAPQLAVPFFFTDAYKALGTWENHAAAVKTFLTNRVGWLNAQINAL